MINKPIKKDLYESASPIDTIVCDKLLLDPPRLGAEVALCQMPCGQARCQLRRGQKRLAAALTGQDRKARALLGHRVEGRHLAGAGLGEGHACAVGRIGIECLVHCHMPRSEGGETRTVYVGPQRNTRRHGREEVVCYSNSRETEGKLGQTRCRNVSIGPDFG